MATQLISASQMSRIDYNMNQARKCKSVTAIEKAIQENIPAGINIFFIYEGHVLIPFMI